MAICKVVKTSLRTEAVKNIKKIILEGETFRVSSLDVFNLSSLS